MTSQLISLDDAYDALEDQVRLFHNDCIDKGIRELPIRDWLREFKYYLDEHKFEREYIKTQELLR